MHVLIRKLLIFSVLIILYSSQAISGTEREGSLRYRYGGSGTQTITIEKEVPVENKQTSWGLLDIPYQFVRTLFEPFIQDAPKVLERAHDEHEELNRLGVKGYLTKTGINTVKAVMDTAKEDPLEFILNAITQGGALALGYSSADSSGLLPLVVGTATGIKQSQLFFEAARQIESRTSVDTISKLALIAGGVYLVASVPGAAALETITLGTQYQVSPNTPGAVLSDVAPTSTAGTVFGVWLNPSLNVVGCTLNATAPGTIFTLSASPTTANAIPSIACGTTNPLCIAVWQCGTDICVRPFNPYTHVLSPITHANTVTSASVGGGECGLLSDGSFSVTWAASDPSNYRVMQRTYSGSAGTPTTTPLVVNLNPTIIQGENCNVGLPGTPSTNLVAWTGGSSPNYIVNYAIVNTASGTISQAAQTISTNSLVQQELSCFLSNGEGRVAWARGTQGIRVQRINAGTGALIGSDYPLQGTTGTTVGFPAGLGTPDGNSFIVVQQSLGGFASSYGGTFAADATGTPQSALVQIPFNPNSNGQQPSKLAFLGGTAPNYNLLAFFDGSPSLPILSMQARPINVQGGSPTPSPNSNPTPSPNSNPTPTPVPTNAPTSAGSSLTPSVYGLVIGGVVALEVLNNWEYVEEAGAVNQGRVEEVDDALPN